MQESWAPNTEVHDELRRLLKADQSRLGEVFRLRDRGMVAEEIAANLGIKTQGFVWNYSKIADALLGYDLPASRTFARATATRFRSLARMPNMSTECRSYLLDCAVEMERRSQEEPQHLTSAGHEQRTVSPSKGTTTSTPSVDLSEPSEVNHDTRSSRRAQENLGVKRSELLAAVEAVRAQIQIANRELERIQKEIEGFEPSSVGSTADGLLPRWSDEEAFRSLRDAATMAFPLTAIAYDDLRRGRMVAGPSVGWIASRFGGWARGCDLAGVEAGQRNRHQAGSRWTDDELLDELLDFLESNSGSTSTQSYQLWAREREDSPSSGPIIARFGGWAEAKERALSGASPASRQDEKKA